MVDRALTERLPVVVRPTVVRRGFLEFADVTREWLDLAMMPVEEIIAESNAPDRLLLAGWLAPRCGILFMAGWPCTRVYGHAGGCQPWRVLERSRGWRDELPMRFGKWGQA